MRLARFLYFAAAATTAWAADNVCPVTKPSNPPFVPPAPYRVITDATSFWYGDNNLWTSLPVNGGWNGLPYHANEGYFNKLPLFKQGYDGAKEQQPDITVSLRRLDASAPMVTTHYGTNAYADHIWAMLTGVAFPTEGCWEVTSFHNGHTLTFVLSIKR